MTNHPNRNALSRKQMEEIAAKIGVPVDEVIRVAEEMERVAARKAAKETNATRSPAILPGGGTDNG
jgi:hypothetical protein